MTGPRAPKHWAMAKKTAIAFARTSCGKISLTVRYAELAPAEAKKKITHQAIVWVVAFSRSARNRNAVIASRIPDRMYVAEIIFLRPTVSNRWPSRNGPDRLPTAKAIRNSGAFVSSTPKKLVRTRV